MKASIKQIIIFNDKGEKRWVPFNDGLNIISGDSKTGKSALIEIVDYCLFSSRSSIPKGEITRFAYLFVVIFKIGENYIVAGRYADKDNAKEAFLNIEFDYKKLEDLQFSYFNNIAPKPIKDDVQTEFEEYLGLSLSKLEDEEEKNWGKLSVRDTVSFLFQHQNLIANKHALFYRFDNYSKMKRVVTAVPVLFGAADKDFYDLSRQEKSLEQQIKAEKKILDRLTTDRDTEKKTLEKYIQIYYTMLGQTLEEGLSLARLKEIGLNLPSPPEIIRDQTKLYTDISISQKERELKYTELEEIENALSNLYETTDESYDYAKELTKVHSLQKYNEPNITEIHCPLCESNVEHLNSHIQQLDSSKIKLIEELKKIGSYSKDYTDVISRLRVAKKTLDNEINSLTKSINQLSKVNNEIEEGRSKREQLFFQKGIIKNTIENYLSTNQLKGEDSNFQELGIQLNTIRGKLSKYNLEDFYKSAQKDLKVNMDRIANKLDFEKELKPIDFSFDLKDFSFKHKHDGDIRLDEMGSGANWLACHLSVFLSFLHLTCSNKKSVIPSFLMIDQPSQVYFPRTTIKEKLEDEEKEKYDDNIEQVKKIFKVLSEEIKLIKDNTGIEPQIIVLEHANDPAFKQYIIKEWDKSKGEGLI